MYYGYNNKAKSNHNEIKWERERKENLKQLITLEVLKNKVSSTHKMINN